VATPATGYRFVNWTGDVATIANVNAASTAIIINGSYSITANFALVFPIVENGTGMIWMPSETTLAAITF